MNQVQQGTQMNLRERTQFPKNSFALIPAQVEDGGPHHRHGTSQHRLLQLDHGLKWTQESHSKVPFS